MASFRDDMPLIAGVNEDWYEDTTRAQITRPDWDFSPIRMKTMHHLPHIFFDTLRPERPDCPVLVPSSFSVSRDKVIAQDIYSYEPCGLPTGNFMPAEKAQIRLMTAQSRCAHASQHQTKSRLNRRTSKTWISTRRRYSTPLSSRAGVQSRFSSIETRRSFSRWTIGLVNYPRQCSATYCLYSQSTPNGMKKTCAT